MATRKQLDLQAYHDGELSPRRAKQVREQLEASSDDRSRLAAIAKVGELVEEAADAAADEPNFRVMWAHIQQGIEAEKQPTFAERIGQWFRRYGVAVASAAAVAGLAVALLVGQGAGASSNDCEVESLDVAADAVGTIMTVADDEGDDEEGGTTVIWVNDIEEGDL